MAREGLRTLVVGKKELTAEAYANFEVWNLIRSLVELRSRICEEYTKIDTNFTLQWK